MNRADEAVLRFITSNFRSVWSLELLLMLKHEPRSWTRHELVTALRASDLVVSRALDTLVAAGLVTVAGETVSYQPANRELEETVKRVEELYRTRANGVRRAIISASMSSATAFADAFKLRRDRND